MTAKFTPIAPVKNSQKFSATNHNLTISVNDSATVTNQFADNPIPAVSNLTDIFFEHKKNHLMIVMIFFGLGMAVMFKLTHALI